ncbi:hydrogenase-4 component A [Proteus mirabilis]|uniref:Hydrogenase-4 component A n=1 Tax=Proteus mirabilis TaxID=584 RepID=A0A2X2C8I8_PROMI|nr:hydrogenase-4 component A [Proteus mirabilis]
MTCVLSQMRGPACVKVCPTDALHLVEEDSLEEQMKARRLDSVMEPMTSLDDLSTLTQERK